MGQLFLDDLISHSITHSISVDNEVGGLLTLVVLLEDLDRLLQRIFHLSLDDLLTLSLHDMLTVVLTQLRVRTGSESDD